LRVLTDLDAFYRHDPRRVYEDLLSGAPELRLGEGLPVHVLDLAALIELKENAGRPKDLAVLPLLRATPAESLRRSSGA
jgi:hypothetical protein